MVPHEVQSEAQEKGKPGDKQGVDTGSCEHPYTGALEKAPWEQGVEFSVPRALRVWEWPQEDLVFYSFSGLIVVFVSLSPLFLAWESGFRLSGPREFLAAGVVLCLELVLWGLLLRNILGREAKPYRRPRPPRPPPPPRIGHG